MSTHPSRGSSYVCMPSESMWLRLGCSHYKRTYHDRRTRHPPPHPPVLPHRGKGSLIEKEKVAAGMPTRMHCLTPARLLPSIALAANSANRGGGL